MKVTIGCDPEFFLYKDGYPVSAHDIVPGTKEEPYKLSKGAVQRDGMAVEFNIDPASTPEEFADNVLTTIGDIRQMVPKEYKFKYYPSVEFKEYYYRMVPDGPKELGCNPDYNAYTGLINTNPNVGLVGNPLLRTGAGHIHLGWTADQDKKDPSHIWDCRQVVKMMDEFYGLVKPKIDLDTRREALYGAKGAFRPTTFGVEYRVPSNAWVRYPDLYPFIFSMAHSVVKGMETGEFNCPKFSPEMKGASL